MRRTRVALALLAILMGLSGDYAAAQTTAEAEAVAAGALRSYSTVYSAGLEWDLAGDVDHDSRATLEYRVSGQSVWTPGLGLVRVDSTAGNMLAGSLLFLAPDTQYDVRVSLTDPDGGGDVRLLSVRTRPLPAAPSGRRVLHVVPGSGGGDGSAAAPFNGVAAAQAAAQPGDTFLLHAGTYGPVRFQTSGTDASYVVWKAAGDGEVSLGTIEVAASHVWLDGLTVRNRPFALLSVNSPTNVVITRCHFLNNHFALYLNGAGTDWYIADNTIVGDTPATSGSFDGEGIDLNSTSGHTVARNSITNVADAISSGRTNVDIFANDIFDTSDDGIEADYGGTNVRIWGNRIHNAVHNGISFQPQSGAPLYIIRNQIVGSVESAFKFRTTDRFVLLHNTIVHWGDAWPGRSMLCCNEEHLLRAYARNNLWISVQGGQIWGFDAYGRDWRTDLDFDGFDWGTAVDPFTYGGWTYPDVWAFANASGLETHGLRVSWRECFEDFRVPGPSPSVIPAHLMTLRPSCGAVDAGTILPNVNDGFQGSAPDLGAHEYGAPAAVYGPRPTVPDNSPPSVALTAPLDGALFTAPAAISISAAATDDDGAIASVDFLANGKEIGRRTTAPWSLTWTEVPDGLYTITARATDDRGAGTASAGATVSVSAPLVSLREVVRYAQHATVAAGWSVTPDATAAGGARLQNPNAGAPKLAAPLASPTLSFEVAFEADAGVGYRLWMRGKATSNGWANDSAYVQFDGSVDQAGAPIYRIGTTSAMIWQLEDCVSCGVAGWGWQDGGYGDRVLGPLVYFARSGPQRLRVQVREDGLGLDQIVLSAERYLTAAPGTTKNDVTILTQPAGSPANAAPAVRVTSPAQGTTFTAPATIVITGDATDGDGRIARVEFLANGVSVGTRTAEPWSVTWTGVSAGDYAITARATDDRGASTVSAEVAVSVRGSSVSAREVVLYARHATVAAGWSVTPDATAAAGARLQNPNAGAPKLAAPLASPTLSFEVAFEADAGVGYRLWMRGKATSNGWANDSAYVQFGGSVDQAGAPIYRIGTTSAMIWQLEDCVSCGVAGWGWQDGGYGDRVLGPLVYFARSGPQRLRVQVREDGLGLDQIVLSAERYLTAAPGTTKNDTTILPQ